MRCCRGRRVPELPEVETVVRDVARLASGATITEARVLRAKNLATPDADTFSTAMRNRRILGARRRAKWIIVELSGGLLMLVHLRMTGQLLLVPSGSAIDPYTRLTFTLADGRDLRFRDVRAFGRVALVAERPDRLPSSSLDPNGAPLFGDHGLEPLDSTFTSAEVARLFGARRARIKGLLLDQRHIAGIGNIYADEALWRAGIHPATDASTLAPHQFGALHQAIVGVLGDAVEARGSSINDYTAPDGDGSMQERLDVYQRSGEPCRRCGTAIERILLGGRGTHFCPRCQPAPTGADRAATPHRRRGPRWSTRVTPETLGATREERATAGRRARRTGAPA